MHAWASFDAYWISPRPFTTSQYTEHDNSFCVLGGLEVHARTHTFWITLALVPVYALRVHLDCTGEEKSASNM